MIPQWKLDLIDWPATAQAYGYTVRSQLKSRSRIVLRCTEPDCLNTYHTSCVKLQSGYIPRCGSCRTKLALSDPAVRECMSKASKSHRSTPAARTRQAETTKQMWQNQGIRNQIITSINSESTKQQMSAIGKALWDNPEFRAKMEIAQHSEEYIEHQRQVSTELWNNPEYCAKQHSSHVSAMRDEGVRSKIAAAAILSWQDQEYRTKQHEIRSNESWRKAASERSKAIWRDPKFLERRGLLYASEEYRLKMSSIYMELWRDPEYRAKVMAAKQSPEYKQARSQQMVESWSDERYRAHLEAIYNSPEYKDKMSKLSVERWQDQEYRAAIQKISSDLWQNQEYREKMMKIFDSEQFKKALSESSKVIWQDPQYREKMAMARANQPRVSSIQKQLYKLLGDMGVPFLPEGPETAIGHYVFDCLIPKDGGEGGVLIECQGDYWHTRPGAEARDKSKFTYIDRYFSEYEVMYLWEHEFFAHNRILERIKLKLGIEIPIAKFDFADIKIRIPDNKDVKEFLDAYHYIGKGRGGKCFGAYHEDQLVAITVYSPALRQNTAGQFGLASDRVTELSRFCIHPSYHKKNFASWFMARTWKQLRDIDLVISYADTTVGHDGGIYKAAGFIQHHVVKPDYWYVDYEGFVVHKRTLYGKAVKMNMTERVFAEQFGYIKRWGGEKFCFIKHIK